MDCGKCICREVVVEQQIMKGYLLNKRMWKKNLESRICERAEPGRATEGCTLLDRLNVRGSFIPQKKTEGNVNLLDGKNCVLEQLQRSVLKKKKKTRMGRDFPFSRTLDAKLKASCPRRDLGHKRCFYTPFAAR